MEEVKKEENACRHQNGMLPIGQSVMGMPDGLLVIFSFYCPLCLAVETRFNPIKIQNSGIAVPKFGI